VKESQAQKVEMVEVMKNFEIVDATERGCLKLAWWHFLRSRSLDTREASALT
jgi:hypothetical protein